MKSFLTAEEAKDIREIAENLGKKERQESEKRYEDFLKTETGRAYKKFVEVFFQPLYIEVQGVFS